MEMECFTCKTCQNSICPAHNTDRTEICGNYKMYKDDKYDEFIYIKKTIKKEEQKES